MLMWLLNLGFAGGRAPVQYSANTKFKFVLEKQDRTLVLENQDRTMVIR